MVRYIDADKVKEEISNITFLVMGGRASGKTIFTEALKSYREKVLQVIDDTAADVVPKSEVESELPCVAYNKKHERYQVIHKGKQGHIFASKLYRNRREAEDALANLKKKYTEASNEKA